MDRTDIEQLAWTRRTIDEARGAIQLAKERVEPLTELLSRLATTSGDQLNNVVYALLERAGDPQNDPIIFKELTRISDLTDTLPSECRARLDRTLGRVLRRIDPGIAMPLTLAWGRHRRKTRWTVALKILRGVPLTDEISRYLLERFRQTDNVAFLQPILSGPLPSGIDADELFQAFEVAADSYWKARVAESVMKSDMARGPSLMARHPHAAIWAAGRLGAHHLVPSILDAFHRSNDKIALLGITVWALGKLGAKKELLDLEPIIDDLDAQFPDPWARSAGHLEGVTHEASTRWPA